MSEDSVSKRDVSSPLAAMIDPEMLELLSGSGVELIQQIGFDVIRGIILDILTGRNLRDSTETLTRSRLAALNMALLHLFLQGTADSKDFVQNLPSIAADTLARKRVAKSERWLANWLLGLTGKSVQNVLRDNSQLIEDYRRRYAETCREIIAKNAPIYGELTGTLRLGANKEAEIDWLFMLYLMNTVGAQTLTIRGSEKSAYGKLFEKLVLGSLLSILGFTYEVTERIGEGIFWLSSQGESRESDATLLYKIGQGVRFDIGFIGRGNSEISLDKVSRFQRHADIKGTSWYMATIIIVDRLSRDSRVERLAKEIQGNIVQMSATYWPQEVAIILREKLGYEHELAHMEQAKIEGYLKEKLQTVPLESFIKHLPVNKILEVDESE
ncbi:MAG TPA: CfrBI family restriction endonuclease [Ktedonobacteraceae bacterium]|nr:CfrBI family restriction endonuclease [Ktedonobacteraceae bacterium]